jgi:hypothetical protein
LYFIGVLLAAGAQHTPQKAACCKSSFGRRGGLVLVGGAGRPQDRAICGIRRVRDHARHFLAAHNERQFAVMPRQRMSKVVGLRFSVA